MIRFDLFCDTNKSGYQYSIACCDCK